MDNKKRLPNEQFRKLVKFINDGREDKTKKIYEDKEPREINWNAYTISQINEAKEILLFIKKEVDKCEMPPKKVGRPLTNPKAKAIILMVMGLGEKCISSFLQMLFLGLQNIIKEFIVKVFILHSKECSGC